MAVHINGKVGLELETQAENRRRVRVLVARSRMGDRLEAEVPGSCGICSYRHFSVPQSIFGRPGIQGGHLQVAKCQRGVLVRAQRGRGAVPRIAQTRFEPILSGAPYYSNGYVVSSHRQQGVVTTT